MKNIFEQAKEMLTWFSIQVQVLWGIIWVAYSQLPPDVMLQLSQTKFWIFNVPALMGIGQAVMTAIARKIPQKGSV